MSMDISALRALIAQAREDDQKATPGPWLFHIWDNGAGRSWEIAYAGKENLKMQGLDPTPFICSDCTPREEDGAFVANARAREPRLARALEAALEVVEAAALYDAMSADEEDDDLDGAYIALADSLSRFRACSRGGEGRSMTQPEETREEKRERLWREYVTVPSTAEGSFSKGQLLIVVESHERAAAEAERERIYAWLERHAGRFPDGPVRIALSMAAWSIREGAPHKLKIENVSPPSSPTAPRSEPEALTEESKRPPPYLTGWFDGDARARIQALERRVEALEARTLDHLDGADPEPIV